MTHITDLFFISLMKEFYQSIQERSAIRCVKCILWNESETSSPPKSYTDLAVPF